MLIYPKTKKGVQKDSPVWKEDNFLRLRGLADALVHKTDFKNEDGKSVLAGAFLIASTGSWRRWRLPNLRSSRSLLLQRQPHSRRCLSRPVAAVATPPLHGSTTCRTRSR